MRGLLATLKPAGFRPIDADEGPRPGTLRVALSDSDIV
jgi:hypothetical protein